MNYNKFKVKIEFLDLGLSGMVRTDTILAVRTLEKFTLAGITVKDRVSIDLSGGKIITLEFNDRTSMLEAYKNINELLKSK